MTEQPAKFSFWERVRVTDASLVSRFPEVAEGHVAGMSCNDAGLWGYAISGSDGLTYDVDETALESLGSFVDPTEARTGEIVRVAVDGKGRGRVVHKRREGE